MSTFELKKVLAVDKIVTKLILDYYTLILVTKVTNLEIACFCLFYQSLRAETHFVPDMGPDPNKILNMFKPG